MVANSVLLDAIYLEIAQPEPLTKVAFGAAGTRPPDEVFSDRLDRTERFSARCSLWFSATPSIADRSRMVEATRSLVQSYWRGDERDEKGRILSAQFSSLQTAFEETLREWLLDGPATLQGSVMFEV